MVALLAELDAKFSRTDGCSNVSMNGLAIPPPPPPPQSNGELNLQNAGAGLGERPLPWSSERLFWLSATAGERFFPGATAPSGWNHQVAEALPSSHWLGIVQLFIPYTFSGAVMTLNGELVSHHFWLAGSLGWFLPLKWYGVQPFLPVCNFGRRWKIPRTAPMARTASRGSVEDYRKSRRHGREPVAGLNPKQMMIRCWSSGLFNQNGHFLFAIACAAGRTLEQGQGNQLPSLRRFSRVVRE